MYRRYYDGYNSYDDDRSRRVGQKEERGELVVPEAAVAAAPEIAGQAPHADTAPAEIVIEDGAAAVHTSARGGLGGLFGGIGFPERMEVDDLLLLGVIVLLLHDSVDDTLLIAVLAVVFLAGLFD